MKGAMPASTPTPKILRVCDFLAGTLTDKLNFFKLVQYIEKSKIAHKVSVHQNIPVCLQFPFLAQFSILEKCHVARST